MQEQHHAQQSPFGWLLLFSGGVVAQVSPTTPVGTAGLIASVAGLLMALFQYYSKWIDAKHRQKDFDDLHAEVERIRKARHEDNGRFNGVIGTLEIKLMDSQMDNGRLKGELKVMSQRFSNAINANADNITAVAEQTEVHLPAESPHVEPINGNSHGNPKDKS